MGRVQMPPHGNIISNIIGKIKNFIVKQGEVISIGDFLQFSSDGDNIVVSPANNRFNAEGIALNDTIDPTSSSVIDVVLFDDDEKFSFNRVHEQIEQTKIVGDNSICAGDFIYIKPDGTIRRATNKSEIHGYAIDSGKFAASIRIKTLV